MAIKRISDLSSILYDSINNNTSFTTIENLEISGGILRDVIPNKNDNNDNTSETNQLKESLFEISWPIKSDTISVGYTNFESRSISYETLSGYITHNILHETYTFVGNKKFNNNVTISGDIAVGGNVYLGNDTSLDEIRIKGKTLQSDIGEVTNNLGNVTNSLSGNLNITLTNKNNSNITINNFINDNMTSAEGKVHIYSNLFHIHTNLNGGNNGEKGYINTRSYNTDISSRNNIILRTPSSEVSLNSDNELFNLTSNNIVIKYSNSFVIKYNNTPVLTLSNDGNGNPTVIFNQTSAGTNNNPISGTINHALWS